MSAVVGSMPSLTRSGRLAASCSESIPSGSTSIALRVKSLKAAMLDCRLRSAGRATPSQEFDGGPRNKVPPAGRRSSAAPPGGPSDQARATAAEEAARPFRPAWARSSGGRLDGLRDDDGGLSGSTGDLQLRPVQGRQEQ